MIELETQRLRLRPFTVDDLEAYQAAIYGDPEVMLYMPGSVPRPVERTRALIDEFQQHWQEHGCGAWAAVLKDDNRLIGHAGLQYLHSTPDVEVFYAFARSEWGKGFAPEAAAAALRFGFEACKLEQIIALAVPENRASRRVMEKIGMMYQGETDMYYNATLSRYIMRAGDAIITPEQRG